VSVSSPSARPRFLLVFCLALLFAAAARVAPAGADAFGPQFPISSGNHPSVGLQAGFQDVVYNSVTHQYLVVYVGATTAAEDDIYGQLLDAGGTPVGPEFRISTVSAPHSEYNPPTVNFDSDTGRYLVSWDRDETVYVRLLGQNGVPLSNEAPISPLQEDIETEAIAYSPASHEYLVVWKAFSDGRVFAQRLTPDALEIGPETIVGGSAELVVDNAVDVAYDATNLEYMVVFTASPKTNSGNEEVYAQRLNLSGAEIGLDDHRISEMGPEGDPNFDAAPPSIAWNSVQDQYLVGWHGNNGAPLAKNEREVYGQLLAADGTEIGQDDFRISDMGPDGNAEYGAFRPSIAYDPYSNQYLLAWHGSEVGLGPKEFEVWGQYLAADGTQIGNNDFRISEVLPDGNADFSANRPALAFDPRACDYLVTYFSGNPISNNEATSAVLGRFASAPPACPDITPPVLSELTVTPKLIASGIKVKAGRATARSSKKGPKKRAKAHYTLSEPASVAFTVQHKVRGIKSGGTCRKAKSPKASGKRCALWVRTGRKLNQQGLAGPNAKGFTARSIRRKGLKPGAYRIIAVATDLGGNRSGEAIAHFKGAKPR
jgi:hypothetical protein